VRDTEQQSIDQPHQDEVDLISIIGILYRYKWIIIGITLAVAVGTVVFSIISLVLPPDISPLPNRYQAEALVLIDEEGGGGGIADAIAQTGLSLLPGLSIPSDGGYGELAVRLLSGNTIVDTIVDEFDIVERYKIKRFVKDNAREEVREHSTVQYESETRTVSIAYEDREPQFAADVVNRMVELLDLRFSAVGINREARKRDMLQEKLVDIEKDIIELEEEIQAFQRRYGTIDPQTYAREHITILAEMRARLIAKEIEANTYAQLTRIDDPVAARMRAEREQLEQTIADMERLYFGGTASSSNSSSPETEFSEADIPELAVRFGRMERELLVQSKIYEVLRQQYEVARLSAEGEELIFQILEVADVPVLKSGPSRSVLCIVVTFAAFFLSVVLVFVLNAIRNVRSDPNAIKRFRGEV